MIYTDDFIVPPDQLRVQEVDNYIALYRINNNSKKIRNKLIKMSSKQWKLTLFNTRVGYSCKRMDIEQGFLTYVNYKTDNCLVGYIESYQEGMTTLGAIGLVPNVDIYNALLSLLAGFGDQGCNVNVPPRTVIPPSNINYAIVVFNDMRKLYKKQLKEATYTAMIRCYSINGEVQKAFELYLEMEIYGVTPKLRTFLPMLTQYTAENNLNQSLKLFDELMTKYKLTPSEREYVLVLQVICATKNNRFYDILNSFKEDILVPSGDTWSVMKAWFACLDCEQKYVIHESIVNDEGVIQVNNEKLQSIDLDNETKQLLLSQIEEFAIDQKTKVSANSSTDESVGEEAATVNKKRKHSHSVAESSVRFEKWTKFKGWLDKILEKRYGYDVIVDGANVGYYKQNYAGAPSHVDYLQINAMLLKLRHLGYNPLLILHCRHLFKNVVPHDAVSVVDKWRADGILYETPGGCNDDWFWLYMAMYLNCKIVTNDEMRDHHFLMLSPRSFARWRERNQIHFSFGSWLSASTYDASGTVSSNSMIRDANLVVPKVYSHRTQIISYSNRLPSYYVPIIESDSWLCIYQNVA